MKTIIKSSGEIEEFSQEKLRKSIILAGGGEKLANKIISEIAEKLTEFTTSQAIFDYVLLRLKQESVGVAAEYNLKRAIAGLGPTGFPFEKFLASIFTKLGYVTETNKIVQGKCINHELDVTLTKDNQKHFLEAKFHNKPGIKTSIRTPLYVHSRWQDLSSEFSGVWIATNTRFSTDSIKYAGCNKIKLLAWDYANSSENLPQLIHKLKIHPITALTRLELEQKQQLIAAEILLVSQLLNERTIVKEVLKFKEEQMLPILIEAEALIQLHKK